MAIIPQKQLFCWKAIENLGDLERRQLVLKTLPDEPLMRTLEKERVNSRLDVSFGFERHFIRGLKKMRLRVGLAMVVMLAMALGRIREKRKELMCSLLQVA